MLTCSSLFIAFVLKLTSSKNVLSSNVDYCSNVDYLIGCIYNVYILPVFLSGAET